MTLRASGLWLGTRTGAGGTATLTESFFGCSPWLHGQQTVLLVTMVKKIEDDDYVIYKLGAVKNRSLDIVDKK